MILKFWFIGIGIRLNLNMQSEVCSTNGLAIRVFFMQILLCNVISTVAIITTSTIALSKGVETTEVFVVKVGWVVFPFH